MDTGHSATPSLVANDKDTPASAQEGRILADMEDRKPQRAFSQFLRRAGSVLSPGIILVALLLLALPWLFARWLSIPIPSAPPISHASSHAPTEAASSPAPEFTEATPAPLPAAPGGAVIIDDRQVSHLSESESEPNAPSEDRLAMLRTPRAEDSPPIARPQLAKTKTPTPAVATTRPSSPASRGRRLDPVQVNNDGTLGPALLELVREGRLSDRARTDDGSRNKAIDALMLRIYGETQQTLATLSEPPPSMLLTTPQLPTSLEVQRQLRACPPANTLQGLRCRNQVCSKHAGEDAACPAPR